MGDDKSTAFECGTKDDATKEYWKNAFNLIREGSSKDILNWVASTKQQISGKIVRRDVKLLQAWADELFKQKADDMEFVADDITLTVNNWSLLLDASEKEARERQDLDRQQPLVQVPPAPTAPAAQQAPRATPGRGTAPPVVAVRSPTTVPFCRL